MENLNTSKVITSKDQLKSLVLEIFEQNNNLFGLLLKEEATAEEIAKSLMKAMEDEVSKAKAELMASRGEKKKSGGGKDGSSTKKKKRIKQKKKEPSLTLPGPGDWQKVQTIRAGEDPIQVGERKFKLSLMGNEDSYIAYQLYDYEGPTSIAKFYLVKQGKPDLKKSEIKALKDNGYIIDKEDEKNKGTKVVLNYLQTNKLPERSVVNIPKKN